MHPYRQERKEGGWQLNEAGRDAVAKNKHLAYYLAKRFSDRFTKSRLDDLTIDALEALVYAATLFDDSHRVPFGTWAGKVIWHQLVRFNSQRDRRADHYDYVLPSKWESLLTYTDPDTAQQADARAACEVVHRSMQDRWYSMLYLYHGLGWTLDEVGAVHGVCRERIRQILRKAEAWARKEDRKRRRRKAAVA